MYTFFVNLFRAIWSGSWQNVGTGQVNQELEIIWQTFANWVMNMFGGEFTTLTEISWGVSANTIWSHVLSTIVLTSISLAVLGLIKKIFSIFFCGVR